MKVLIAGGGGREHALAWKAAQSPDVTRVFVAPGNGGTAGEEGVENVAIRADALTELRAFAEREAVGLVIVGPEDPLVAGIADVFAATGIPCFAPEPAAAQLEGSKAFAKAFLARHGIPTAEYAVFEQTEPALDYLRSRGAPIVVKADGLAAGKGVIVAQTLAEAKAAVRDMLDDAAFGTAGRRVVIEECLTGEEASFIAMVSGSDILPLASSQDHKARDDGDHGPNTGGMGAYSPAPVVTPAMHDCIMREVMRPTIDGLAAEGIGYVGFLYAGIMITPDGTPKVLEFNCRFGDPETQPIMLRLRSDLVALCLAAIEGRLGSMHVEWDPRPALGVVMAAGGYPRTYRKGDIISGLDTIRGDDVKVFHAGTAVDEGAVVTAGGRVLCVTALGDTVSDAQSAAYAAVERIRWNDCYYRTDIGYRAIAREA